MRMFKIYQQIKHATIKSQLHTINKIKNAIIKFIHIVITHFWTSCLLKDWQKQRKKYFFRNPV